MAISQRISLFLTRCFWVVSAAALSGVVGYYAGRRSQLAEVVVKNSLVRPNNIGEGNQAVGSEVARSAGDASWQALARKPATLARNGAMADYLEQLSATAPARALQLAQAEANLHLRERLLAAALRGWARVAPDDAAGWALARAELAARTNALRAVFAGAADRPEDAVRLGRLAFARDPEGAMEHGVSLIGCLIDAGHGDIASRVALESDPPRPVWVIEAYAKWSALQPAEAARAAAALPEGEARVDALRGTANGWGEVDPGGLAQFFAQLPASGTRRELLGHSLRQWVTLDPVGASKWIDSTELGPDMDEGVAAVATMSSLKADVATSWAESIANPQLRSETLAMVLREWGRTDPGAAAKYLAGTRDLQPEERRALDEFFRSNLNAPVP